MKKKQVQIIIIAMLATCVSGGIFAVGPKRSPLKKFVLPGVSMEDSLNPSEISDNLSPSEIRLQKFRLLNVLAQQKKDALHKQPSSVNSSEEFLGSKEILTNDGTPSRASRTSSSLGMLRRSNSSMSLSPIKLQRSPSATGQRVVESPFIKPLRFFDERTAGEHQRAAQAFRNLFTQYEPIKQLDEKSKEYIARLRNALFHGEEPRYHNGLRVDTELATILEPINHVRALKMTMAEELFVRAGRKINKSTPDERVNATMIAAAYRYDLWQNLGWRESNVKTNVSTVPEKTASRFASRIRTSVYKIPSPVVKEREENKEFLLTPESLDLEQDIMQEAIWSLVSFIEEIEKLYNNRPKYDKTEIYKHEASVRNYCASRKDAVRAACMLTQHALKNLSAMMRKKISDEEGEYKYFKALGHYREIPLIAVLLSMEYEKELFFGWEKKLLINFS